MVQSSKFMESKSSIQISPKAAEHISKLLVQESKEQNSDVMLRIVVSSGGCSGFQYAFEFDDQRKEKDLFFEKEGAKILIDGPSLDLLNGAEIDFREELIGSALVIKDNPNATSSCGCGSSFSIF
jgi:iron-sulfur cluster insertion protein